MNNFGYVVNQAAHFIGKVMAVQPCAVRCRPSYGVFSWLVNSDVSYFNKLGYIKESCFSRCCDAFAQMLVKEEDAFSNIQSYKITELSGSPYRLLVVAGVLGAIYIYRRKHP
jgi:hypothetical protein